jgi:hypothetical protein
MIIAYEVINGPYVNNTHMKVWEHLAKHGLDIGIRGHKKALKIPMFRNLYAGEELHMDIKDRKVIASLDEIGEEVNVFLRDRPITSMTLKAMTLKAAELCRGHEGIDECELWFGMHTDLFYSKNVIKRR